MAGLLDFLSPALSVATAAGTAHAQGKQDRAAAEQASLIQMLNQARQAQQDKERAELHALTKQNLTSQIKTREAPKAASVPRTAEVGGSLYEQKPDGSWGVAVQGPVKAKPTYEERKEGDDGVAIYEDGQFKSWKVRPKAERGPQAPQDFKQENALRDEVNQQMKDHQSIVNAYRKVQAGAKGGTAASDMSLIFGFMRLQDPTSTVREGEYATAQNAGSWSDAMRNYYNRAKDGQKLQPGQRDQFVGAAKNLLDSQRATARQVNTRYEGLAKNYGINPKNIMYDPYTEFDAPVAPADIVRGARVTPKKGGG